MAVERALVTGATSGIGEAVARRLGRRGALVGVLGRNAAAADMVCATVVAEGGTALPLIADVADPDQVAAAVERFASHGGGIDTVVASAGIGAAGTVIDTDIADWRRIVDVNLGGVFFAAKFTMPFLLASRGTFTAISSDAGITGGSGFAAYSASKHGVVGLVRCLALDHGPSGVRSNVICPAFVETPMISELSPADRDFFEKAVPLGRFATADEVAAAVAFLSSAEASYFNGAVHHLDGGSTAGYFLPA